MSYRESLDVYCNGVSLSAKTCNTKFHSGLERVVALAVLVVDGKVLVYEKKSHA